MSYRNGPIEPNAYDNLNNLKKQVSMELGVEVSHASKNGYSGYVPMHRCGDVGGTMVKKMIEEYERKLIDKK